MNLGPATSNCTTQYKEYSDPRAADVNKQLVACCSKELHGILSRNLGNQQFETDELELFKHIEQLAVKFQNPAVLRVLARVPGYKSDAGWGDRALPLQVERSRTSL